MIIVSGPTASGKSSVAIRLAKELGGEIVVADSVAVYRGFDIGSAKTLESERDGVKHHLLDCAEPQDQYSVADFLTEANLAIKDIRNRGKLVVVAGGTSLYINALLNGLAKLPAGDVALRERLEKLPSETLLDMLKSCDPESAKQLHLNDRLRVVRAIETFELTGTPLSQHQKRHREENSSEAALILFLNWKRDALYERINLRTAEMLKSGLIAETKNLISEYGENIPALSSLGYGQCVAHLKNKNSIQELSEEIAQATRRFAKRQRTFWRNEPVKRGWKQFPEQSEDCQGKKKEFSSEELSFDELACRLRERLSTPLSASELWFLDAAALNFKNISS